MEIQYLDDCSEDQVNKIVHVSYITVAIFRNGKYIFVKRRTSSQLELPEIEKNQGEKPREAVRRLLTDKLGVISARLDFITAYSRTNESDVEYGLLYCADIEELGPFPHSDLGSVYYLDNPPEDKDKWSDPETQMPLLDKAIAFRER